MKTAAFIIFLAAMTLYSSHGNAVNNDNCRDDPRLAELPAIIEGINRGERPESPLEMTPDTFIRLQPAARKALGNDILVCGIPLTSKGIPAVKLEMDFHNIWDALQFAAGIGDWENVKFIGDSVRAKKLPLAGIWSLLTRPTFSEDTMTRLSKTLGIPPHEEDWDFYVLDVYTALGGYAEKPEKVVKSYDDMASDKAYLETNKIFVTITAYPTYDKYNKGAIWRPRVLYKSLSRAGIRLGDYTEATRICHK